MRPSTTARARRVRSVVMVSVFQHCKASTLLIYGRFQKKLPEFFDSDILQLFEFARFLFARGFHVIGKRSSRSRKKWRQSRTSRFSECHPQFPAGPGFCTSVRMLSWQRFDTVCLRLVCVPRGKIYSGHAGGLAGVDPWTAKI